MRIGERGQVTIPKMIRDQLGLYQGVEVQATATEYGLLIQKSAAYGHPVDRIAGALDGLDLDVDQYIEEIRGR